MKRLLHLTLLVIILLGTSIALSAPSSPDVSWWTVDGGGAVPKLTGGTYSLQGSTGQADAGLLANGSFALSGGYWNSRIVKWTRHVYLPLVIRQ
jgi:hypothetical protein